MSEFKIQEGQYAVEANLDADKNKYYVVAKVKGDSRRSRIISVVVGVEGRKDKLSKSLESGDLRTVNCGIFEYCKEQILKGFSITENGRYRLTLRDFRTLDQVEIRSLNLHSNHGVFRQGTFILIGMAVSIVGIFMFVFSFFVVCYNKFLQWVKKSFTFLSR